MSNMTITGLEKTIKHYVKAGDFRSAENYVKSFGDEFKNFNKEEALKLIKDAQNGIKSTKKVKQPIKRPIKEE